MVEDLEKLVVVLMGQDCERFIGMALESVKDADAIVYCDGGSTDKTLERITHFVGTGIYCPQNKVTTHKKVEIIENPYDQEDKRMNGKQRNFYLNHLKKHYPGWWCLVIDADEVVEDLSKIKEAIQIIKEDKIVFNVKMRHFIGDLGHEDATQQEHYAPRRLFKVRYNLMYPEVEHSVLQGDFSQASMFKATTIWHLAYCPACWDYKKRYENHLAKSNMHTPEFLDQWYKAHLFGQYPKVQVNLVEIPKIILDEFGIDKDEFYFQNRGLELRHFLMFKNWFDEFKPKSVLELGCGLGPYGVAAEYMGCKYLGVEISGFAVKKNPFGLDLVKGDVTHNLTLPESDLVLVVDILEHLEEKELRDALKNISVHGKNYIFSIPFKGDPNLEADPTHKIKKDKDWWLNKLNKYFKIKEVPNNWLLKEQLLMGERK